MKKAVILANGDFPTHPYPLQILRTAESRICCDGAAEALLAAGLEPHKIIGDLDSLPDQIRKTYAQCITHDPDQETNDLTKAVNACRQEGYQAITILGATGKREDHTLGNIGLLAQYAQQADVEMITDHGIFTVIQNQATLATLPGQQVSFFNTTKGIPVTAHNVKYPLENLLIDQIWQGTLNEATGSSITISAPGAIIIVFLRYAT